MAEYTNFRQRLDAILRTLDVKQVREFLIALDQWSAEAPSDPEFAMWMMIAGSPTLRDLHERAREWLVTHGHEDDAEAILGKGKKQNPKQEKVSQRPGMSKGERYGHQQKSGGAKRQDTPKRGSMKIYYWGEHDMRMP